MVHLSRIAMALCLCVCYQVMAGGNLYPEGDFEAMGNSSVRRSGGKSLMHEMREPKYYVTQGHCRLQVEPYAVYEASGYVKGQIPTGYGQALAFYGWDSFGWGFMSQVPLPREIKEWRRFSTRFSVPVSVVDFSPLVLSDVKDGKVWIDDVSIVKIQGGKEHLLEIEAKKAPSDLDLQLLARAYLGNGQVKRALALREKASAVVRADITCQLALRSKELAETRRLTIELMKQECLQWPDGKKRVAELLGRFPFQERLSMCKEAILAKPAEKVIGCLQYAALDQQAPLSIRETREHLKQLEQTLADVRAVCKQKGLKLGVMGQLEAGLASEKVALAARERAMGHCRVSLSGHEISRRGAVVVLPAKPTPSERTAARELALNLELLTGELLEIVPEPLDVSEKRYPMFIGRNPRLAELGMRVDYGKLGKDGIHLENNGRGLVLAGGQRGVLYAVYSFLEEQLGFRWFTPDCSTWPRQGVFALGNIKKVYVPALKMRATDYYAYSSKLPFPVRSKYNSLCMRDSEDYGGDIHYRGFVHTMNGLVPVKRFGASHPEYYALRNGVRKVDEASQPCLTNPEVLRIAIAEALRWCEESPRAQIISISQNDNQNFCQCEACMALARKEGSQMGPLLHFVNAIAREIGKKYPNKVVDTLAYQYTRKPPKFVRPEPNVAIRLCSIECCFVHPLESCPYNRTFVDDIVGWSKICRRLHIWDYVINYAHTIQPFPNLRVLQPNIRFFIEHGVTGVYEEANYFSRGAEMAELRTYLMGKLLWDPSIDVEVAIREFTDGYFGAAGSQIREYLKLLHDTVCTPRDRHVGIYAPTSFYLNDEKLLRRAEELFAEGERLVAGDPVLLRRVKNAKLPLLYTRLNLKQGVLFQQGNRLVRRGTQSEGHLDEFRRLCQVEGVTHVGEGRGRLLKDWLESQHPVRSDYQILTIENKELRMDILPALGGRIWRLQSRRDGRQFLRVVGDDQRGFKPETGGMEWYSTADYRGPGYGEDYQVLARGKDFAELSVRLDNGRKMIRRIRLLADRIGFKVTTEVVRTGGDPVVEFRCHPEFTVSSIGHGILFWKDKSGKKHERVLADPKNPLGESELWLTGDQVPAGEWGVRDGKTGICLRNRFEPGQIGFCYSNWNGAQSRVNLEIWSKAVRLPVGGAARMEVVYEVELP